MSDVVDFKLPAPPAQPPNIPTLKDKFGNDDWLLKMCTEWRIARAQQQKNWAEYELANGWGTLPDSHITLDTAPLDRMKELELHFAHATPRTVQLARELLRIAVTILAHSGEDPESVLSEGPVLDIVRNVVSSLDWLKAETTLGRKQGQHAD